MVARVHILPIGCVYLPIFAKMMENVEKRAKNGKGSEFRCVVSFSNTTEYTNSAVECPFRAAHYGAIRKRELFRYNVWIQLL